MESFAAAVADMVNLLDSGQTAGHGPAAVFWGTLGWLKASVKRGVFGEPAGEEVRC
ncbi:hypothetical protein GALLR39Z86_09910 [Glycomyces algeriensis]|uniref:Uncharacterized protein n=1 Tax=Glycomyces algeriensis TaxID=256037 RepID=A0A9W6G663_9ACTN|nr:hypothetical protein GALLR39Z86_09910 [Glycomyces algeriensis]